jgi:WD40 repeat protein
MELIRGTTLKEYCAQHRLDTRQKLEIFARLADAVQHAHQRGLIHRDLKPGNILVDESGQPKILDFGVARATDIDMQATGNTSSGQVVGTPAYMSPEQALGDPLEVDTRTDVYALGAILYELLAGRLPSTISKNLHETLRAIREEDPLPLSSIDRACRGDIETIAATALEKDKSRRYGSATEFAADLRRYLNNEPIVARPASVGYQLRKFARRHQALVVGIAAVMAVLIVGMLAITLQARRAIRAEARATSERDAAVAERTRANENERTAELERDRARAQEQRAILLESEARAEAKARLQERYLSLWQFLARASILESTNRDNDDLAALLARQALLFHHRTPDQPRQLVEEALQQALRFGPWSRNLLPEFDAYVYSVEFSRDGNYLAAAGSDGLVRLWDTRKPGAPPFKLSGHSGPVSSVAFSPDGIHLASGGGLDNSVRIWDLVHLANPPIVLQFAPRAPLPVRQTPLPQGKVNSVAFSPDGRRLAASGLDTDMEVGTSGTSFWARVWDMNDLGAKPLQFRQANRTSAISLVYSPSGSVAFSPDGNRLACVDGDSIVRLWDLRNPDAPPQQLRAALPEPSGTPAASIAFSPDGSLLAAVIGSNLRLWDPRGPNEIPTNAGASPYSFGSIAFSHDGSYLAAGHVDRNIRIWSVKELRSEPIMILQGHDAVIRSVAFSPDGTQLASGSSDKTVRLWNLRTSGHVPKLLARAVMPATNSYRGRTTVAFSGDGQQLAAGGPDLSIWDPREPDKLPLRLTEPAGDPRTSTMAFSADGAQVASSGADGFMRLWNLKNRSSGPTLIQAADRVVSALAFSRNGQRLASSGGAGSAVRVWDQRKPNDPPLLLQHSPAYVYSVALSSDGTWLAAGNGAPDNNVLLWNLRKPGGLPVVLEGHQDTVQSVAFSADDHWLASGSNDGTVRIRNLRNLNSPPLVLQAPGSVIYSVGFSPDGLTLAAGGTAGIFLFDLRPRLSPLHLSARSPTSIGTQSSVAFSHDGTHLASGGEDGSVRLWPLWSAAADFLCTRVSRNLSMDEWRSYIGEGIPYERTCPKLPPGAGAPN